MAAKELLPALAASGLNLIRQAKRITTGLTAVDQLAPAGGFALGAMHEVLSDMPNALAIFPALIARAAGKTGWIVWFDPERSFYPMAAAALGLCLERLLIVHPSDQKEGIWAAAECLRCGGVDAWVGSFSKLTFLQARRLQLAAERGGGIGILLRPARERRLPYAAATRWLVCPERGEKRIQRQSVELIHGHGGQVGKSVLLEVCRETCHVRATQTVAHRTTQTQKEAATA